MLLMHLSLGLLLVTIIYLCVGIPMLLCRRSQFESRNGPNFLLLIYLSLGLLLVTIYLCVFLFCFFFLLPVDGVYIYYVTGT